LVGFAATCIISILASKANVKGIIETIELSFFIILFLWPIPVTFFVIFLIGESIESILKELYNKAISK
jgi:hypothetical protein